MADISFKQSRGEILRGMMRNPTISKTIREAINSPLGSTSRTKAKKIFDIMQKLNASHDGLGGPGMPYERTEEAPQPYPVQNYTDTPKGMVVFRKIPTPNIVYGKKPKTFNGEGGPGRYDGKGGIFDTSSFNPLDPYNTQKPFTSYPTSPVTNPISTSPAPSTSQPSSFFNSPIVNMFTNWGDYWDKVKSNMQSMWNPTPSQQVQQSAAAKERQSSMQLDTPPIIKTISNIYNAMPEPTNWANLDTSGNPKPGFDIYGHSLPGYDSSGKLIQQSPTIIAPVAPTDTTKVAEPSATDTQYASNWSKGVTGYGAEILPGLDGNRLISSLTQEERKQLTDAQRIREGSTLPNNPFGIKVGSATQHWIDEGKAVLGSKASDGGQFLVFKDEATANAAHDELLYNNPLYSGLTVDAALKKWSGYGPAIADTSPSDGSGLNADGTSDSYIQTIWDKYNIDTIHDKEMEIFNTGDALSKARNTYLLQTDAAINGLMEKFMASNDMSNPINQEEIAQQLQYLYSLRGRATTSYLGQLNDAITQNQTDLSNIDKMYSTAVTAFQNELQYPNKISPEQYELYKNAIGDVGRNLDSAPGKQSSTTAASINLLNGSATSVSDSIKALQQQDLITQGPIIEKYWGWDGTKTHTSVDLVKTIQDLAVLAPTILPVNIIQAYDNVVTKYIGQPNDTGTTPSGTNISTETKKAAISNAITQFASLYRSSANDPTISLAAYSAMTDMASHLSGTEGSTLLAKAPQLKEAVKTLNARGWFGPKATPTEDQFIATITKATGDAGDSAIASAVYDAFKQYLAGDPNANPPVPGGTADGAVNALLYKTSSTGTKDVPFTDEEFTQNIGNIYVQSLVNRALGL